MLRVEARPTNRIPLLDLKPQYAALRDDIQRVLASLCDSQQFILGSQVEEFEREIAAYCGISHAVGCASGSDALLLALRALDIGPGHSVLTTAYSFFATAGSIAHAGAIPVFADIEPTTFNLDPNHLEDTLKKTANVRAIIAVHLFGGCAAMDEIHAVAARWGVPVIEDAAQAIGSEYKSKRAGGLASIGCFSFFPSKNLGAFGDAGMITTEDGEIAHRIRSLRVHGSTTKYRHTEIGYNSRLDAIQAAVLRVKLPYLDGWTNRRQENAQHYRSAFAEVGNPVMVPEPAPYQTRHIYNQFVIRCERRDQLQAYLAENGIGSEVYYPIPLHLQPCFSGLGYSRGFFPVSERAAADSLALPIYADLPPADIQTVVSAIASFYR